MRSRRADLAERGVTRSASGSQAPAPVPIAAISQFASDRESPPPDSPQFSAETGESRQERKTFVLLAEDNRADALLIEEAIEAYKLPIELHVVEDGEAASAFIQRAETDPEAPCPQLLILDLNLPIRSGIEVLRMVRAGRRCRGVPVIIVTSSNSPRDRKEVARHGADHYFRKPS